MANTGSLMGWSVPDLAGNFFDWQSAQDANRSTEQRIDRQNAFNANQANTVYTRGVADLKAAGLNPILAAGGATAGQASAAFSPAVMPSYHSAALGSAVGPKDSQLTQALINQGQASARSAASQADIDEARATFYQKNPELAGFLDATKGHDAVSSAAAAVAQFGDKIGRLFDLPKDSDKYLKGAAAPSLGR